MSDCGVLNYHWRRFFPLLDLARRSESASVTEVGTVDNGEVAPAYLEALVLTTALCALLLVAASVTFLVEVVNQKRQKRFSLEFLCLNVCFFLK